MNFIKIVPLKVCVCSSESIFRIKICNINIIQCFSIWFLMIRWYNWYEELKNEVEGLAMGVEGGPKSPNGKC